MAVTGGMESFASAWQKKLHLTTETWSSRSPVGGRAMGFRSGAGLPWWMQAAFCNPHTGPVGFAGLRWKSSSPRNSPGDLHCSGPVAASFIRLCLDGNLYAGLVGRALDDAVNLLLRHFLSVAVPFVRVAPCRRIARTSC